MKTKEPTTKATDRMPCFDCEAGTLEPVLEDYVIQHPRLGEVTVPEVPLLRCAHCGSTVLGEEANERIDGWLDCELQSISPKEIRCFLDKYSLTQKEASRITGLGEKNLCRWLGGRSRPSESVSNLLRLLLADEAAFERLRARNFGEATRSTGPAEDRQPDAEEARVIKCIDYPKLVEMRLVKSTRSPKEKRTELCRLGGSGDLLEFRDRMTGHFDRMAAFKDTRQKCNAVSGGLWVYLGEKAAVRVRTEPFHRDKLWKAVDRLRELTCHPLDQVARDVLAILAEAGVALVFMPLMRESALRGCTRLMTPSKAMIIHGLKYRNLSQFWIILFHEIAHLLLHIEEPGDEFADYEDQAQDQREIDADRWAYDTLVSENRELEFRSRHPAPSPEQVRSFAETLRVHPAIVAEVFNRRAGREVISYSRLKVENLFPHLSEETFAALMATSSFR